MRIDTVLYCVVIHRPTGRAFGLGRGYHLTGEQLSADTVREFMRNSIQDKCDSWLPSQSCQRPTWVERYPDREFTAFWREDSSDSARKNLRVSLPVVNR